MIPTAVRFMGTPLLIEVYTHQVGLSTYFDTYFDDCISDLALITGRHIP